MKYFYLLFIILFTFDLNALTTNPPLFNKENYPSIYEQNKPRPGFRKQRFGYNTIFVEGTFVYGYYNAQKYSLNFDLIVQTADNTALTLRVGYEKVKMNVGRDRDHIPLFANFIAGKKNHFELSAGALWNLTNNKINPIFSTGFRHHSPKGGFFFRLNVFLTTEKEINEVTKLELKRIWLYGPSASIGWSF